MKTGGYNNHTIIIGAGPAGLACAACLQKEKLGYTLLEKEDHLAVTWRRSYDHLHLHTDKYTSSLPFLKFPSSDPLFPSRKAVIQYLDNYAKNLNLRPQLNQEVARITWNGQWEVQTGDDQYFGDQVIVATGLNDKPCRPSWEGMEGFPGQILHSSEYKNGQPFKGIRVLVVGFGNSACEIAMCLYAHGAQPVMSVRGPVNIVPATLLGVPVSFVGSMQSLLPDWLADWLNKPILNFTIGNLEKYGLPRPSYGPVTQVNKYQKIPPVDGGIVDLIKAGKIPVLPGIENFRGSTIHFTNGDAQTFDAVILGTGYRSFINDLIEVDGFDSHQPVPLHDHYQLNQKGLFFCGFRVAVAGMLREIGKEARQIAKKIKGQKTPQEVYAPGELLGINK